MISSNDSSYNSDSKEALIRVTSRVPIWKSRSRSYPGVVRPDNAPSKACRNHDASRKSADDTPSSGSDFRSTSNEVNSFITSHREVEIVNRIQGNIWSAKLEQLKEAKTKSTKTNNRVTFFSEDLQHIEDDISRRKILEYEDDSVVGLSHNDTNRLVQLTPNLEKITTATQEETRTVRRIRSLVDILKQRVSNLSFAPHTVFRKSGTGDIAYNVLEDSFSNDETHSDEIDRKTHEYTSRRDDTNMQQSHEETCQHQNADAAHFIDTLHRTRKDLQEKCAKWNRTLQGPVVPALSGEIRSVIGQARLLITERFQQFEGLVHKFVNPLHGDKPILKTDLEGFWEMISYQIQDVEAKFDNLDKYKERRRSSTTRIRTTKMNKEEKAVKVAGVSKTTACVSATEPKSSKHYTEDAKKRLKDAKNAMKGRVTKRNDEEEAKRILNETPSME